MVGKGTGVYDQLADQHGARSAWSMESSHGLRADPTTGGKVLHVHTKWSRWSLSTEYQMRRADEDRSSHTRRRVGDRVAPPHQDLP